jgi:Holliday junction resolvase
MANTNRIGDITELDICHYFLEHGFEVFRNVSSSGPVDFVTLDTNTGEITLYDSKTVNPYINKDGKCVVHLTKLSDVQKRLGVMLVGKYGDTIITGEKTIL